MVDAPFMTEVAPPILIKDGPLFLGTCPDAGIPAGSDAGVGLFHRDTRYLSSYDLTLGGCPPLVLMSPLGLSLRESFEALCNLALTDEEAFASAQTDHDRRRAAA